MIYSIKVFNEDAEFFNASECLSTNYTDIKIDFTKISYCNDLYDYHLDNLISIVSKGSDYAGHEDGNPLEGLLIELDNGYILVQQLDDFFKPLVKY